MVGNRITFGGLASGLDTNAVIDALMEIQRRPIETQQIRVETRRPAQLMNDMPSWIANTEIVITEMLEAARSVRQARVSRPGAWPQAIYARARHRVALAAPGLPDHTKHLRGP